MEIIPADANSCADALKLLADETRLKVVEQLMDGPLNVGEINAALQIEPTLLSHHLRVLRDGGMLTSERVGKTVVYSLSPVVQGARRGRAIDLGCCKISFG